MRHAICIATVTVFVSFFAAPLLRANAAFQAVQVSPGTHRVHLFYRDRAFEIGAGISIGALMVCVFGGFALRLRRSPA